MVADVRMTKWTQWFLPVWTFFLGLLIGGLEGGLAGNWGAVLLYVLPTGAFWAIVELVVRRRGPSQPPTAGPAGPSATF